MHAMLRTILHVDMDAFYASIEQRDHPEWKGRPVVVGAPPDRRGVVAACSYEARGFGIHSAMPSRTAAKLCPQAVFVPCDMPRYAAVSRQVFGVVERFSPLVEPLSLDEAFLDVTGARRLFGDGAAIARRLRAAIAAATRLTASVGVAPNKFLAKIASELHKPDGLTVVPSDPAGIREFLAPLPIGRLWGVGRKTQALLGQAGLRTIGDLARQTPAALARLVGRAAADHYSALARGEDDRPVEPEGSRKQVSCEHTFERDCADRAALARVLANCVEDVGRHLREEQRYAGEARLKLRWADFTTITRQRPLPAPSCDDDALHAAARALFGAIRLAAPVRLIGFGVARLADHPPAQPDLFETADGSRARRERLSRTVDDIRRRFGRASLVRGPPGTASG